MKLPYLLLVLFFALNSTLSVIQGHCKGLFLRTTFVTKHCISQAPDRKTEATLGIQQR